MATGGDEPLRWSGDASRCVAEPSNGTPVESSVEAVDSLGERQLLVASGRLDNVQNGGLLTTENADGKSSAPSHPWNNSLMEFAPTSYQPNHTGRHFQDEGKMMRERDFPDFDHRQHSASRERGYREHAEPFSKHTEIERIPSPYRKNSLPGFNEADAYGSYQSEQGNDFRDVIQEGHADARRQGPDDVLRSHRHGKKNQKPVQTKDAHDDRDDASIGVASDDVEYWDGRRTKLSIPKFRYDAEGRQWKFVRVRRNGRSKYKLAEHQPSTSQETESIENNREGLANRVWGHGNQRGCGMQ